MSTTIEFIRQLNQSAVDLSRDWLSRLQVVAGTNQVSDVAEIVVVSAPHISDFVVSSQAAREEMQTQLQDQNSTSRSSELQDTNIVPSVSPSPKEQREQPAAQPKLPSPGEQSRKLDILDLQDKPELKLRMDKPHATSSLHSPTPPDATVNSASTISIRSKDIRKITDQILQQYPPVAPAILMFVPDSNDNNFSETIETIARELASRTTKQILSIDATQNNSPKTGFGLAEVVNRELPIKQAIQSSDCNNLSTMHLGDGSLTHRKTRAVALTKLASELRSHFQYICVAAPSIDDVLTQMLSRYCEVCYLVIDLNSSDQKKASLHVDLLRRAGARLGGCIVRETHSIEV